MKSNNVASDLLLRVANALERFLETQTDVDLNTAAITRIEVYGAINVLRKIAKGFNENL